METSHYTVAVLGLAGILPRELMAVIAIVVGAGLLLEWLAFAGRYRALTMVLEIPTTYRLEKLAGEKRESSQAIRNAVDVKFLVGLGAVVLGILSLVEPRALTLTLVALLAIGTASLLSGSGLLDRMISVFER